MERRAAIFGAVVMTTLASVAVLATGTGIPGSASGASSPAAMSATISATASPPAPAVAPAPVRAVTPSADPPPAQGERLPPGSELEVTVAQVELYSMPPGLTRNVRTTVANRIGTALRGARLVLVTETESLYQVRLGCQDDRVRIEAWAYKDGLEPARSRLPAPRP